MSEEEIDAIVGRLSRERAERIKRRTAIDEELAHIESVTRQLFRSVQTITSAQFAAALQPVRKYFSADGLIALIEERERVQAEIVDRANRLKGLGVPE